MKILIKVTKEILFASRGCQRRTMDCVIARACREIFPRASVLGHTLFIDKIECGEEMYLRTKHEFIELPETAYQLITAFDRAETNEQIMQLPLIQFEIEVPSSVIDKIEIQEAYRILSESKTLELVKI